MPRFLRRGPKHDKPPGGETIEGLSVLLQDWLLRMQDLVAARRTAKPGDVAGIDEMMDQLCQEAAEDVERDGSITGLSKRLQRMKRITLEELCEQRDKARQERRVDG